MVKNKSKKSKLNDIYSLFVNNKFKALREKIEITPKLLRNTINDNKTVIQYTVQTNNFKLLKQLVNIDKSVLLNKLPDNEYITTIALEAGFDKIFFYLVDKIIELEHFDIFNNLTTSVIIKKNWDLFKLYVEKYNKYINWLNITENYSYLYLLGNLHYERLDDIINIFKPIIQKYIDEKKDVSVLFKYPLNDNLLFFLTYIYTKPEQLQQNNIKLKEYKLNKKDLMNYIDLYPEQLNYPNQTNILSIYYLAENNNLDLLKFCIDRKADINHISPLGYSNFAHHVMKYSNKDTVQYILGLNIYVNHLDANNETPIYNLVRNKSTNIHIDLICKLLELTDNWDIQNIYGQSIIHILVIRPDIELFFDTLKTKYFDINLKNKFNSTVLQLLENNYISQKLNKKEITNKLEKFKELIVNNYINILTNTDSINVPENIKLNCFNYNKNNKDNSKTSCWLSAMNSLSKTTLTDIDKLSKNYIDLIIDDYQFAHYNLYNARDSDIYVYYKILMNKHFNLGIPFNDNKFDKKNIMLLGKFNTNTQNISNIEYMQLLVNTTIKYPMLYPLNIYWLNETNYMIPYNIVECVINTINLGKTYIICRINIINDILHANILLIDIKNKRFIRFEPQGGIKNYYILDDEIFKVFKKNKIFKDFKYFKPSDYEPINGLQSISQETNTLYTRKGDMGGFCLAWCMWFIEFYIENISNNLLSENNLKIVIHKVIKRIINSGYLLSEYIRNYANYMHEKLLVELSNTFQVTNLYFEKYTSEELEILYNKINNDFQMINN
jgi:hypothetical protein